MDAPAARRASAACSTEHITIYDCYGNANLIGISQMEALCKA